MATKEGKIEPNPNSGVQWRYGGRDEKKRNRFTGTLGSVAIHEGLLILGDSNGYVHCFDARTGKHHWKHDARCVIAAAPLIVDGKIYVPYDFGVGVFELSKDKKPAQEIELDASFLTAPVFANGVLYLATATTLYAIAGKK